MEVFHFERLRSVLRVAVPVVLGLDMIHSFYYVGCLIQEKKQLEAERREKSLMCTTVHFFNKVSRSCEKSDFGFWPQSVASKISETRVPDLSAIPRPSYELIDDEEEESKIKTQPPTVLVFPLKEWKSKNQELPTQVWDLDLSPDEVLSEEPNSIVSTNQEPVPVPWRSMMWNLLELVIPYPVLHPIEAVKALYNAFHREIRLHVKNSDGYFAQRGNRLRTILNVPYFIIERRSALRFRFKTIVAK